LKQQHNENFLATFDRSEEQFFRLNLVKNKTIYEYSQKKVRPLNKSIDVTRLNSANRMILVTNEMQPYAGSQVENFININEYKNPLFNLSRPQTRETKHRKHNSLEFNIQEI